MAYRTINVESPIPNYKQFSGSWANKLNSCGGTMASEGCIITSVAMMIHFVRCNVTPGELLECMKKTKKQTVHLIGMLLHHYITVYIAEKHMEILIA